MQKNTTVSDASTEGTGIDRRILLKGAFALGAFALVTPLAGCANTETEEAEEDLVAAVVANVDEATANLTSVDFEGFVITLNLDHSTWQWDKINNTSSNYNGCLVVGVPVVATNTGADRRLLNYTYCKIVDPNGTTQADISAYYTSDDILQMGSIQAGSEKSGLIHIVYQGSGTYTLQFDNLLGRKAELAFSLSGSAASGLQPIPDEINTYDADNSIPYGTPFTVDGLTLTFSSDETTYWWTQAWDDENEIWNGRWCVGVPLTMTNNMNTAQQLTSSMYALYAPACYKVEDPAPWFADYSACNVGPISPGQSVESWMWWPYIEDGNYYVAFDNDGAKTVAFVHFIN